MFCWQRKLSNLTALCRGIVNDFRLSIVQVHFSFWSLNFIVHFIFTKLCSLLLYFAYPQGVVDGLWV